MDDKNETHLECTLSDADLFTPAFQQSDIQHGFYEDVFPISKLDDSGSIEFNPLAPSRSQILSKKMFNNFRATLRFSEASRKGKRKF